MTGLVLACVRALRWLPLRVARGVGAILGVMLHLLAHRRRHIVDVNLALCMPQCSKSTRKRISRRVFVRLVQSWIDRGWLWHPRPGQLEGRLAIKGNLAVFADPHQPVIIFAPHFMGLDAGWVALTRAVGRPLVTIYTRQSNEVLDTWIRHGRTGAGDGTRLHTRDDGIRPVLASIQQGAVLYLLPDMDFGAHGATFAPFFGVPAATTTSLARLAKLSGAIVVSAHTRFSPVGYQVVIGQPWQDYPTGDPDADAVRMNQELERLVEQCPDEYYWVHKRFKTPAPGQKRSAYET